MTTPAPAPGGPAAAASAVVESIDRFTGLIQSLAGQGNSGDLEIMIAYALTQLRDIRAPWESLRRRGAAVEAVRQALDPALPALAPLPPGPPPALRAVAGG